MPISTDQQAQAEMQIAVQTAMEQIRHQNLMQMEAARSAQELRRAKMELIRVAKEVLTENARSKPADSRDVSAADIIAFAAALEASVSA